MPRRERLGHHQGERFADEPHDVAREHLAAEGPSSGPSAPSTLPLGGIAGIARSSAVKTATTPGIARAPSTSTPITRACGIMERTNTARSTPVDRQVLQVSATAA